MKRQYEYIEGKKARENFEKAMTAAGRATHRQLGDGLLKELRHRLLTAA